MATSLAPLPAEAKTKAMVVIARIQSYGAVFAGIDILQSKSHFLREKWSLDGERKGVRWLRRKEKKKRQKLDLYIYRCTSLAAALFLRAP